MMNNTTLLISALQQQNQQLLAQNQALQALIEKLQQQLANMQGNNDELQLLIAKLQQQLDQLLRQLYGKKSEKQAKPTEKTDAESGLSKNNEGIDKNVNAQQKRQPKRNPLPVHLMRQEQHLELPEEQRICCACGQVQQEIGALTSEQLEYIPARLYVKQFIRHKYACSCKVGTLITAPLPAQPIDKGLAGPGLLADILISKYQDAMPLYRQMLRFKRHDIEIAESTLGDWVAQGANWLAFIVNAMKPDLLANKKLGSDDTPVPVLAKGKTRQGYLWVYRSDGSTGIACTIYDFTPTRSQQGPLNFLVDYQGYLQADAYAGYDALYAQGHVIEVACFAHARRKFFDIAKALNGLQSDADEALHFIGQLYQIERAAKGFTIKTRYYYRRRYAKPLLKKLRRWLRKKKRVYLPKTPLAGAINYMLNQWRALMHYLYPYGQTHLYLTPALL